MSFRRLFAGVKSAASLVSMQSVRFRCLSSCAAATDSSNLPELQNTPSGRRRGSRQGVLVRRAAARQSSVICNGLELSDFGKSMSAVSVGVESSRIRRQVSSAASDLNGRELQSGRHGDGEFALLIGGNREMPFGGHLETARSDTVADFFAEDSLECRLGRLAVGARDSQPCRLAKG